MFYSASKKLQWPNNIFVRLNTTYSYAKTLKLATYSKLVMIGKSGTTKLFSNWREVGNKTDLKEADSRALFIEFSKCKTTGFSKTVG